MDVVGIICEYNPFHNGHIYHLNKVKELYPNSIIILILSGNFTQRGIPSIINKWDKTEISLKYGIDLVVELPFPFATQSADIFAKGAIRLLTSLKTNYLVFGSESKQATDLIKLADLTINNDNYDNLVKKYLDMGNNYPTSLNKALEELSDETVVSPNDLLGFSYVKEIIKQKANIKPVTIQRTNSYHENELREESLSSATSIRKAFIENKDWIKQVPEETIKYMKDSKYLIENYFPFLKYKIISTDDLSIYQTVDEGIENKIKKEIEDAISLDELIKKVKSKRYTYNKLCRMFTHILCNFTKEQAKSMIEIEYIRILGFSDKGQKYLNKIKKETDLPIITNFSKNNSKMLMYEKEITGIYASVLPETEKVNIIKQEYQNQPKRNE